jgi:DNA-binding LacI/PurR family transcriptional regulator/DNA-binding transcriptional regulator YhcF (GntR family)
MRPPIYTAIANRVRKDLPGFGGSRLPSTDDLARRYHISRATMTKAIALLRRQGLVACLRGRGIYRIDAREDAAPQAADAGRSGDRLYDHLKTAIAEGTYPSGGPLPKFDHLVHAERVSRITVTATMRRLDGDRLIHKLGKRWIVGPAVQGAAAGLRGALSPAILVFVPTETDWYSLFNLLHNMSFALPFSSELLKQGVRIIVAQREVSSAVASTAHMGIEQVREQINRLGNRYCGALVFDRFPAVENFNAAMGTLSCRGARPVVYFDAANAGGRCTRSTMRCSEQYFRLHLDERAAVKAAMQSLRDAGHSRIGFPLMMPQWGWPADRLSLARAVAAEIDPSIRIFSTIHGEPFWSLLEEGYPDRFANFRQRTEEFLQSAPAPGAAKRLRSFQARLMDQTPSMKKLLDNSITAMISMNDRMAHEHYLWFKAAGIDVPRRMSMVAFDNLPESVVMPISTVDFGFARLGHLAAHILLGDSPIKAGADGAIPGICTLVDRGSIAAV